MIERVILHKGSYHDSAFLMRLAREIKALEGVDEAVVLMGTEMNRALLAGAGFDDPQLAQATPMDLVVAVRAELEDQIDAAEAALEQLMHASAAGTGQAQAERRYASMAGALAAQPETNLVSVAVPGQYAGWVAGRALEEGKHVFLFSNNVPLEQELALKARGRELGLLVMGPDCGTAILAGVGLGFANRVRPGHVGIVGPSGTGMQEISSLVHRAGEGVSQAIGTGSRDLKSAVDGQMSQFGLELLADDEDSRVLVLVAKPPAAEVAERMHGVMAGLGKPVVVRYLGQDGQSERDGVFYAGSLDEAACEAVARLTGERPAELDPSCSLDDDVKVLLQGQAKLGGRLVGLFGGGSLTTEAALILRRAGLEVDIPDQPLALDGPVEGQGHIVVDTGEDFYTLGKPHPMVEQSTRCDLIRKAGSDPAVRVLLLDVVLGDGAHLNPAPELTEAVAAARQVRGAAALTVIASVSGTELDPQDLLRQMRLLAQGGVHVQPSAARAARVAAQLLTGTAGGEA